MSLPSHHRDGGWGRQMKERRKVVLTPSKLLSSREVCGLEHSLSEQVDSSSHRLRSDFREHPRENQMPGVSPRMCAHCRGSLRAFFLQFRTLAIEPSIIEMRELPKQ